MIRRWTIPLLILVCLPLAVCAQTERKIRVAVLDLSINTEDLAESGLPISDSLREEIFQTGVFDVVDRADMDEILMEQSFQMSGCTSDACAVEAGQLLNVERMITGSLGRVGSLFVLNLRLIDVESGLLLLPVSVKRTCSIEEIVTDVLGEAAVAMATNEQAEIYEPILIDDEFGNPIAGYGDIFVKTVPPGATIYLDGEEQFKTAPLLLEEVVAGPHAVLAVMGSSYDRREVEVLPDEMIEVEIFVQGAYPSLKVLSEPFGANVHLDGELVGRTPQYLKDLAVGSHHVLIEMPGYIPQERTIDLTYGDKERLEIGLVEGKANGGAGDTQAERTMFVSLPGGTFRMGSEDHDRDERPVRTVTVAPFLMQRTEVTQAQWLRVMRENPSKVQDPDLPVTNVSRADIGRFLERLNAEDPGHGYRLPTEAEWEYACRAGATTDYPWGPDAARLGDHAWSRWDAMDRPHEVALKEANAFGLFDMLGNVSELCRDQYRDSYDGAPTDGSAVSFVSRIDYFVVRGGSYRDELRDLRCTARRRAISSLSSQDMGFRLAADLPAVEDGTGRDPGRHPDF